MAVEAKRTGMLLIISGPSGTGKGTLVEKLMKADLLRSKALDFVRDNGVVEEKKNEKTGAILKVCSA